MLGASIKTGKPPYVFDPIFQLVERFSKELPGALTLSGHQGFSDVTIQEAETEYRSKWGILGIFKAYFKGDLLGVKVDPDTERRIVALKLGFPHMPATKATLILQGLEDTIKPEEVKSVFASYGMSHPFKRIAEQIDFFDLNRRVARLYELLEGTPNASVIEEIQKRYVVIRTYLTASKRDKETAIRKSGMNRSQFFFYWKSFKKLGAIGLIDKKKGGLRQAKVDLGQEARIVIDRLQHPKEPHRFFLQKLAYLDAPIKCSRLSQIFTQWNVKKWHSAFDSDLKRLQNLPQEEESENIHLSSHSQRLVDLHFTHVLEGLKHHCLHTDSPGLFALWAYLEELQLLPVLDALELSTSPGRSYSWLELFLLDIGRRFYGISSHTSTCEHEGPNLPFFCGLVSLPTNDSFLNGLGSISSKKVVALRKFLLHRMKELGLLGGSSLALDFHQIDWHVFLHKLRDTGLEPSRKICHPAVRPHIAWDLENNCLLIAEFRKGSARGTTTFRRFVKEYILPDFKDLIETVYIDSEYTGKDVWSFILDDTSGIGAHLTACLKQNPMVRKKRDDLLFKHQSNTDFWKYYDDTHVYGQETFKLSWPHYNQGITKDLKLTCVIKKNLKNGKLRCFGTSRLDTAPRKILEDYANRWTIENGIKDLIYSYFLDSCPGTRPHNVDVHFLSTSICRYLYRMIERDLGKGIKNPDGTTKSLRTMRSMLFGQDSASLSLEGDTIVIKYLNAYRPETTNLLREWYKVVENRSASGLQILGGLKLRFELQPPTGEELRNSFIKVPICTQEKN